MSDLLGRFGGLRLLILGDALLDSWLNGHPSRLCREGPVAVVDLDERGDACGGAGNTAVNVAALGAGAALVSVVGADAAGDRLRGRLAAAGVTQRLVVVPGRGTPVKSRLLAEGCDAVVVCDYGAGTLTGPVRAWLRSVRPRLGRLVVDAHELRRWTYLSPDLVTPNVAEAARLLGTPPPIGPGRAGWVAEHAARLAEEARAGTVAVTLDADGAVLIEHGRVVGRTHTRPVPPVYATGAGDAYVAAFTLGLGAGAGVPEAGELAQRAAESAVSGTGTAVCSVTDLAGPPVLVDAAGLGRLVAGHRARGRRIVFTNGCFDVLHRGHVGYLAEASRLGDVLVVAVNSDESVRRLKGPDRPVNPVEDRAAVLAALACVDHVVVFDEDSPRELIELVRPDLYVKGGDYPPELIPEAELVRGLGGEVRVMAYLPDLSTSKLIERIRSA